MEPDPHVQGLNAVTGYHVTLFFHLLALLAAISASTIVHVAMVKVRDAATGGDALGWLRLAHAFARVFPVALVTLLATGAWLVHESWSWSSPFVLAGVAGVVFLFVSGAAIEGGRAGKLAASLAAAPQDPVPPAAVRDPVWWCASWANTGVAIGVVLAMVAKPGAAGAALSVGAGLCAGVVVGLGSRRGSVVRIGVTAAVLVAALCATAQARADVSSQLSVYAEDSHGVAYSESTSDLGVAGRSSVSYDWPLANPPEDCSGEACGYAVGGATASTDESAGVLRATTGGRILVGLPKTPDAGADASLSAASRITDWVTLSKPATVWLEGTVHGTVESRVSNPDQLASPNADLSVEVDLCCRAGGERPVPFGGYEQDFVPDPSVGGPEPVDDSFSIPVDLPAGATMLTAAVTAQASLLIDGVPDLWLDQGALLDADAVTFHLRVPDDVVATSESGLLPIVGGASADATAPSSTATLADTPNAAGWNAAPTTVHIAATDDGSGVASITYALDGSPTTVAGNAVDVPVTAEGETTLTYFATDAAGNAESPHTLAVRIDTTPPAVVYAGNAGTYSLDDDVSITCAATDALSGIASTTCADVTAPAYTFGVGTTTFDASATDAAGNVGTGATSFTVVADGAGLGRLTVDLVHGSAAYRALDPRRAAVVDRLAAIALRAAERRFNVHAYDAAVRLLARAGWLTEQQSALLQRLAASV